MDEDDLVAGGGTDDDLSLPKATVAKIIREMLPEDIGSSVESRDLIAECCVEFIHLLASESNEVLEAENKKKMVGEHVLRALERLGFASYVEEVKKVMKDHKAKPIERKLSNLQQSGLSQEELIAQQEQLFSQARQKYQAAQHQHPEDHPTTSSSSSSSLISPAALSSTQSQLPPSAS